jgi:hypothetical protein
MFNVEAQMIVNTHVLVRDPYESKEGNKITTPVWIEKLETRYHKKNRSHVVAKTIFTSEDVKKLPARQ